MNQDTIYKITKILPPPLIEKDSYTTCQKLFDLYKKCLKTENKECSVLSHLIKKCNI